MTKISQFQMFGDYYGPGKQRLRGRDFWRLCESVISLYERNFRADIRMPSAYRVSVTVGKEYSSDHLKELGILAQVEVIGDPEELFALPDAQKPKRVLKWLHSGCLVAAKHFGWPKEPFERARQAVVDAKFENKWVHRHSASRRDRKFRAELHCELDLHQFRSELVIFDRKRQEIARLPDLKEPPDRMIFGWSLGKMSWVSSDRIEIRNTRYPGKRVIDASAALAAVEKSAAARAK